MAARGSRATGRANAAHRRADVSSALLARQQPVDAEAAASGHERENEAAHYGEVLVEVVVLRTARGCFGELPVPVRAQGGDDHEQKQQRRDIAGRASPRISAIPPKNSTGAAT